MTLDYCALYKYSYLLTYLLTNLDPNQVLIFNPRCATAVTHKHVKMKIRGQAI